jgi:tyrosinase
LYNKIQDIANAFPDNLKSQYVSAAQDFRIPYWDWGLQPSSGQNAFPSSVASAQVQVTGTDGKLINIPNPLERYYFNVDNLSSGDFPDAPVEQLRCPFRNLADHNIVQHMGNNSSLPTG